MRLSTVLLLIQFIILGAISLSHAQEKPSRFSLALGAGYADFYPFSTSDGLTFEHYRPSLLARADYRVRDQASVFAQVGYLSSSESNQASILFNGDLLLLNDSVDMRSVPFSLGLAYQIPAGRVFLNLEVAGELHFFRYTAEQTQRLPQGEVRMASQRDADKRALGYSIAAGPEWPISKRLALAAQAGYRAVEVNGLRFSDIMQPSEVSLDIDGFFFESFLRIQL